MFKTLRFSLLSVLAMLCGTVFADTVTDELTHATFGVSGTTYKETTDVTVTSSAVYSAQSAGGNESIQLRSNNNNSGIVTTGSGGKVKSVSIEFNSNTANARVASVYGSNTAYSAPSDLYSNDTDTQGDLLGEIAMSNPQTIEVEGDYTFIGIRSKSGAMYIDKITIVWETEGGQVTPVTIDAPTFTPEAGTYYEAQEVTISAEDGTTIYYTLDGSNPTDESTEYTEAFTVSETTTVKAIAVKGDAQSKVATAKYEIVPTVSTFAELKALGTGAKAVYVGKPFVTYMNGKYIFMEDYAGTAIQFYNCGLDDFEAGHQYSGNMKVTLGQYNGAYQITAVDATEMYDAGEIDVTPTVMSVEDMLKEENLFRYVQTNKVSIENGKLVENGFSTTLYDQFKLGIIPTETEGWTFVFTGIVGIYKTTFEFFPVSLEEENAPVNQALVAALKALEDEIANAKALYDDDMNTNGREDFKAAIDAAEEALELDDADEVNEAVETLKAAEEQFLALNNNKTTLTWVAAEANYENGEEVEEVVLAEGEDYVATFAQGENKSNSPKYYTTGKGVRLYAGNTMTISGGNIVRIVINYASGYAEEMSANVGTYAQEDNVGTWKGLANSVTFTRGGNSGHVRITSIAVTYRTDLAAPATPATPTINGFEETDGFFVVSFNVPTESNQGKELVLNDNAKLEYQFFVEKDGEVTPLKFEASLYENLEEDMTVMPADFTDKYDFFPNSIYLLMPTTGWNRLGLQSYYTVKVENEEGELEPVKKESEVAWIVVPETVGVASVEAQSAAAATYTDLQGRQAQATAKGLLIKQVRMADGTVKTMKVVRR